MNAPYNMLAITFTGGLLGTLSMRVLSPSFWWIGMIIGALVAIFMKSGKEMVREVAQCDFKLEQPLVMFCEDIFLPVTEFLVKCLRVLLETCVFLVTVGVLLWFVFLDITTTAESLFTLSIYPLLRDLDSMTFLQWTGCYLGVTCLLVISISFLKGTHIFKDLKEKIIGATIITGILTPPSFAVVAPIAFIVIMAMIVYQLIRWTTTITKGLTSAGSRIWNDDVYACAVASGTGAMIGHWAGNNPLIGGISGLVLAHIRTKIHTVCSIGLGHLRH